MGSQTLHLLSCMQELNIALTEAEDRIGIPRDREGVRERGSREGGDCVQSWNWIGERAFSVLSAVGKHVSQNLIIPKY